MGLAEIRAEVAAFAASFDPSLISPADAERVVRDATAIENIAATVKSLAAARAAKGGEWRRNGARSAAHDLARKTGSTVARAKEALDTGEKLAELPELDAAARSGELSPAQAAPIADAATADRASESRLVARAKRSSVAELRDECARTKAAAEADDDARHRAMHRSRSLRSFRCADRAGEIRYRSTLDEVAELMATIRGYGNREFDLARLDGRREPERPTSPTASSPPAASRPALLPATTTPSPRPPRRPRRPTPGHPDETTTSSEGATSPAVEARPTVELGRAI